MPALGCHFHSGHVICLIAPLPHNGYVSRRMAFVNAQGAVEGVEAAEVAGDSLSIGAHVVHGVGDEVVGVVAHGGVACGGAVVCFFVGEEEGVGGLIECFVAGVVGGEVRVFHGVSADFFKGGVFPAIGAQKGDADAGVFYGADEVGACGGIAGAVDAVDGVFFQPGDFPGEAGFAGVVVDAVGAHVAWEAVDEGVGQVVAVACFRVHDDGDVSEAQGVCRKGGHGAGLFVVVHAHGGDPVVALQVGGGGAGDGGDFRRFDDGAGAVHAVGAEGADQGQGAAVGEDADAVCGFHGLALGVVEGEFDFFAAGHGAQAVGELDAAPGVLARFAVEALLGLEDADGGGVICSLFCAAYKEQKGEKRKESFHSASPKNWAKASRCRSSQRTRSSSPPSRVVSALGVKVMSSRCTEAMMG